MLLPKFDSDNSKCSKKWFFQKIALEYDFSYNIGKDDISFSQKYDLVV